MCMDMKLPQTVRNGQKVASTCPKCGCRLNKWRVDEMEFLTHFFGSAEDKDARGCKCPWYKEHFHLGVA